jgi:hypothetical protein
MPKLTDTQLIILSAASQRDDRGVELPANLKGGAARKVVDKLIRAGLLEEARVRGSLPQRRRDDDNGPQALRITKQGLEAVGVKDAAAADIKEPNDAHGSGRAGDEAALESTGSRRKRTSDTTNPRKTARQIGRRGKGRITADKQRGSRPGSKQDRVLAMLRRPEGARLLPSCARHIGSSTRSAAFSLGWCARSSASISSRTRSTKVIGSIASSTAGVLVPIPADRAVAQLERDRPSSEARP